MHPFSLRLRIIGLVVTTSLAGASVLHADWVTDWNAAALSAMRTTSEAPYMARDLAILHVAMYNASETMQNNYTPYSFGTYTSTGPMSGPAGASLEAAVATAANTIMQSLYSGSKSTFDSLYGNQMATITDGQAKTDGITWGDSIARDVLAWRSGDGASLAGSTGYFPVGTIGYWNQTSATPAKYAGWGTVNTFAIGNTTSFQGSLPGGSLAGYVGSSTTSYAADFNEVKEYGSSSSIVRDPSQLTDAYFWSAPTGSVQVPGMWNQVAQGVASNSGLSLSDSTRLFAALNVALADASITALATAYDVQLWRPETAIANGGDALFDADGNPNTTGDANWLPLINSPDFPEYVSLTSTLSGAAAGVLEAYAGNSYAFTLGGDIDGNGTSDIIRNYSSFSQAASEAGLSGIYAGTQFRTSVMDGAAIGSLIGAEVSQNFFQNVPEPSGVMLAMIGLGWLGSRRRRI